MDLTNILGLIVLVAAIYAVIMIVQSSEDVLKKILWSLLVLILPLIGVIIWYFAGPGKKPF
jgi:flagellar motor component MotA